jgi:hypothetical protein
MVEQLANALDVLSTEEKHPVSIWALHRYLSENCEGAKGEESTAFFTVTVAKALDQMKQTEMLERKADGLRLTERGRCDLLRKGEMRLEKVADDTGAEGDEPKAVTELRGALGAEKARISRMQAEIDDLRAQSVPLLRRNEAKLWALGVNLTAPELLMAPEKVRWSMDEFLKKASAFAPTLVLIKMKNGTECGGVAGVPWPKRGSVAADPGKSSFIFSLGATPARFDLVKPETALWCSSRRFEFGYGDDLFVRNDGDGCGSSGQRDYAGPRKKGELVGAPADASRQPYERWELWRL